MAEMARTKTPRTRSFGCALLCLLVAALSLLSACVATGPRITSEEEKKAREALVVESKAWQKNQQERINEIASRLLEATGTQTLLNFVFVGTLDQTGARIHPDVVNAWTDGKTVWVTRGMMRFLKSDDELASVMAHEMAHALRGHMNFLWAQNILGSLLTAPAGIYGGRVGNEIAAMLVRLVTTKFDRDHEREADLYGLIWAYRAGFNVDVGKEVFRRMAIEMPESTERGFLSTHPSPHERFLSLDKIAATLKAGSDPLKVFGPKTDTEEKQGQEETMSGEKVGAEDVAE